MQTKTFFHMGNREFVDIRDTSAALDLHASLDDIIAGIPAKTPCWEWSKKLVSWAWGTHRYEPLSITNAPYACCSKTPLTTTAAALSATKSPCSPLADKVLPVRRAHEPRPA